MRIGLKGEDRRFGKQGPRDFDELTFVSAYIQDRSDPLRREPWSIEESIQITRASIPAHLAIGRILPDVAQPGDALCHPFEKSSERFHAVSRNARAMPRAR